MPDMPEPTLDELLNPGRKIEIKVGGKIVGFATVFVIGVLHLKKYSAMIGTAISILTQTRVSTAKGKLPSFTYLSQMLPHAMISMLPLIEETTKLTPAGLTFEKLTHVQLGEIASAWLQENFGSKEKWGPWAAVADQMVEGLMQLHPEISETASTISSEAAEDTTSKTSSIALKEPAQASPTPAGV